jgi:hypothetical protein
MKTLTLLYTAIRGKLFSRARKTAADNNISENTSENLKDNQSDSAQTHSHADKSNRSDEIQGFSVNTQKTGDKENNGDKI